MQLSILFFNGEWHHVDPDPYRLFRDSSIWADQHAFHSVWVPERHFSTFGGLFPNPSLLAASLALTTKRIGIRAGSVVAPFWDPVRIAEDWAVIDNLSKGRAGLAFASGWHVDDFCLAPTAYERRKELTLSHIDHVRTLWSGEALTRQNGAGKDVEVRTAIRPPGGRDIPIWLAAASDETIGVAARAQLNVLLSVHHQKVGDNGLARLAPRVANYRTESERAGAGRRGWITLLVHTLVCRAHDVERIAKPAYAKYLETNLELQAKTLNLSAMTAEQRRVVIDRGVNRMVEDAGLIGTVDHCRTQLRRFAEAGIDEVACLIDFGAPYDVVMDGLRLLSTHLIDEVAGMTRTVPSGLASDCREAATTWKQ